MSFRLEHITVVDRIELGCTCVLFAGQYGLVTNLAHQYGVSRPFLYALRDRTRCISPSPKPYRQRSRSAHSARTSRT